MPVVSEKTQQAAAEKLAEALGKMEGVESSVDVRTSGTQNRPIVNASVSPENWRKVAEELKNKHEVDHCSMITGIHWPESTDKTWEVV
jgi:NADH:ubiquinone oxidoreductase subunit C